MICQMCHKNTATTTITTSLNNITTQMNLCPECLSAYGYSKFGSFDFNDLFSDFFKSSYPAVSPAGPAPIITTFFSVLTSFLKTNWNYNIHLCISQLLYTFKTRKIRYKRLTLSLPFLNKCVFYTKHICKHYYLLGFLLTHSPVNLGKFF